MTHGSLSPQLGVVTPGSPPRTAYDAPTPVGRMRRTGALSLAAGTFLGLGALVGPIGVANATPACDFAAVTSPECAADAFADGGTITLGSDVTVDQGLTLESGKTLTIDLDGHTLTVRGGTGADGTLTHPDGDNGISGITNNGELTVRSTTDGGAILAYGGAGGAGADGGAGNPGSPGNSESNGGNGGDGSPGGNGGTGGHGGHGIANSGKLLLADVGFGMSGGDGGKGGNGGQGGAGGAGADLRDGIFGDAGQPGIGGNGGDGGDGGDALQNDGGTVATSLIFVESLQIGHGGKAGDNGTGADHQPWRGADGDWFSGRDHKVTLKGNGGASPDQLIVYAPGSTTVGAAISVLATSPLAWPARTGYTLSGWQEKISEGEYADAHLDLQISDDGSPYTFYAKWTAANGPQPDPGTNSPAAPTSAQTPVTTSKPAAPSTTAPATKPAATTSSRPSTTTPSIPTNNLAAPETFVSTSAPAPQPLPEVSEVDDTSASQFDVDTHNPTQGGDLTLTARGFKPGTVVDFWMHSTPVYLGSAIADIHGIAVLPVVLTPELAGDHHVQSIGTGLKGEPRNLAQPITIEAPPALASTGTAAAPLTFLAVLLLAGGAALMLADRRRAARH